MVTKKRNPLATDPVVHFKQTYAAHGLTPMVITLFRKIIYTYYTTQGRTFPWRTTRDPYQILVSEIMLQQTTTQRVIPKYQDFITHLPDFATLAATSPHRLLTLWKGLGYNRRALALKQIAEHVTTYCQGTLPTTEHELRTLPGIGPYTAAAICAFAYNQSVILLDTNIQSVYIYFFFDTQTQIKNKDIVPLITQTLDTHNPREWYYALMDYGAMLKKMYGNPSRKSAHYTKQHPFKGSTRQFRGLILAILLDSTPLSEQELQEKTGLPPHTLRSLLIQLHHEGFIVQKGTCFTVPDRG